MNRLGVNRSSSEVLQDFTSNSTETSSTTSYLQGGGEKGWGDDGTSPTENPPRLRQDPVRLVSTTLDYTSTTLFTETPVTSVPG